MSKEKEKLIQRDFLNSNNQIFIYIFFIIFFFIGISISKDYGISTDEPFHRTLGYFWYIQILESFSSNTEQINFLKDKYQSMYWSEEINIGNYREYGVLFDLLCVFVEELFNIEQTKQAFNLKHTLNFLTFFISSIFFYKIINSRFDKNYFALLITFFYITSPRIFAESFYNPKDIIFMCFCVYALYFCLRSFSQITFGNIFLFSLFSAFATSIRILGILFFFLFVIFILLCILENKKFLKKNYKKIFLYIILYPCFLYLFWPFLWESPLESFIVAFNTFANYEWGGAIFYLGNYIKATNLPWHYIPVWIYISMPILIFLFFIVGLIYIFKKFVNNFLNLSEKNSLWKKNSELMDFVVLSFFFLPLFAVIFFNSTLYGGWRHLYFVYPAIVYFIAIGIDYLLQLKNKKNYKLMIFTLLTFTVINNLFILIKFHPYQNVFFNFSMERKANKFFEVDYWGLGNAESLNHLQKLEEGKFSIAVASFTPLNYSNLILNTKNKIEFKDLKERNAKYIFSNYIYEMKPNLIKKYKIPENYFKIFSLKRGKVMLNEIYKIKSQ